MSKKTNKIARENGHFQDSGKGAIHLQATADGEECLRIEFGRVDLPVVHSGSRTKMGLKKITVGVAVEWRLFDPGRYERNASRIIDPN
jgi:hypothetical protein